jgi:hypothetical protein
MAVRGKDFKQVEQVGICRLGAVIALRQRTQGSRVRQVFRGGCQQVQRPVEGAGYVAAIRQLLAQPRVTGRAERAKNTLDQRRIVRCRHGKER